MKVAVLLALILALTLGDLPKAFKEGNQEENLQPTTADEDMPPINFFLISVLGNFTSQGHWLKILFLKDIKILLLVYKSQGYEIG